RRRHTRWPRDWSSDVSLPISTDVASARALVARGGDRIHLMHVWRYHPGVEALGVLVRDGALGEVAGLRSTRVNGPSPRLDTDPEIGRASCRVRVEGLVLCGCG